MGFNKFGNALSMNPTTRVSLTPAPGDRVVVAGRHGTLVSLEGAMASVLLDGDDTEKSVSTSSVRAG